MGSPGAPMALSGRQNHPGTTTNFSRSVSILVEWIYAFSFDHHRHFRNNWVGIYSAAFLYGETWQEHVMSPRQGPRKSQAQTFYYKIC